MNQTYRHSQILELIKQKNFVSIDELVDHFKVTPQTIRKDLNALAKTNVITRHHGGACLEPKNKNKGYLEQKETKYEAITEKLAQLIPNNSSLFINTRWPAKAFARSLVQHQNLKIVTNNIHIAAILSENESFSIILAGGEVRNNDGAIIGETTCEFINQFQMDFGIIEVIDIDNEGSLLDYDYREAHVSQSIIQNSRQVILVVDQAKHSQNGVVRLGNINKVHHLFTEATPSKNIKKLLKTYNVKLHKILAL